MRAVLEDLSEGDSRATAEALLEKNALPYYYDKYTGHIHGTIREVAGDPSRFKAIDFTVFLDAHGYVTGLDVRYLYTGP